MTTPNLADLVQELIRDTSISQLQVARWGDFFMLELTVPQAQAILKAAEGLSEEDCQIIPPSREIDFVRHLERVSLALRALGVDLSKDALPELQPRHWGAARLYWETCEAVMGMGGTKESWVLN